MSDRAATAAFLTLIGGLIPAAVGWACVANFAGVIISIAAAVIACSKEERK
jgi:hypothetical protein